MVRGTVTFSVENKPEANVVSLWWGRDPNGKGLWVGTELAELIPHVAQGSIEHKQIRQIVISPCEGHEEVCPIRDLVGDHLVLVPEGSLSIYLQAALQTVQSMKISGSDATAAVEDLTCMLISKAWRSVGSPTRWDGTERKDDWRQSTSVDGSNV